MQIYRIDHLVLTVASIERSGATGGIVSAYLRDPDGNLLELSNYGAFLLDPDGHNIEAVCHRSE